MGEVDPKLAVVLDGPGFYEQEDLVTKLEFWDFKIRRRLVGNGRGQVILPELQEAGLVVMRGPWSASSEDALLVTLLADRLQRSFAELLKGGGFKADQTVIAIGRGALLLMQVLLSGEKNWSKLQWEDVLQQNGPWVDTWIEGDDLHLQALVQGRARPRFEEYPIEGLKAWLTCDGVVMGWKLGENIYISLVDILALADRTQLSNFGYQDLTNVLTQVQVLEAMIKRKI